jgi:hypothetical protein
LGAVPAGDGTDPLPGLEINSIPFIRIINEPELKGIQTKR